MLDIGAGIFTRGVGWSQRWGRGDRGRKTARRVGGLSTEETRGLEAEVNEFAAACHERRFAGEEAPLPAEIGT